MRSTAKSQVTPKVHASLPKAQNTPLGAYIEQLNVPGMSAEQTRAAAVLIQSGKAGYPAGTK